MKAEARKIEAPDDDMLCDLCNERPAVWEKMTYRGSSLEPPEWEQACNECAGVS